MQQTTKSPNGTSFHGQTISLSRNELQTICACAPASYEDPDDKVQYEWNMETASGDVFTIYDWKEYRSYRDDETIEWHIGAHTHEIAEEALDEIDTAIAELN
jgi:hypothetical protein